MNLTQLGLLPDFDVSWENEDLTRAQSEVEKKYAALAELSAEMALKIAQAMREAEIRSRADTIRDCRCMVIGTAILAQKSRLGCTWQNLADYLNTSEVMLKKFVYRTRYYSENSLKLIAERVLKLESMKIGSDEHLALVKVSALPQQ